MMHALGKKQWFGTKTFRSLDGTREPKETRPDLLPQSLIDGWSAHGSCRNEGASATFTALLAAAAARAAERPVLRPAETGAAMNVRAGWPGMPSEGPGSAGTVPH